MVKVRKVEEGRRLKRQTILKKNCKKTAKKYERDGEGVIGRTRNR
jgi:hypothetical protein